MPKFPISPQANRPLWQILLAPMLLASLGLHALFLMIPVASSDEAVIPPPDPEQDNIAITRIPPETSESAASNVPVTLPAAPLAATQGSVPSSPPRAQPLVQQPAIARSVNRQPSRTVAQPSRTATRTTNPNLPGLSTNRSSTRIPPTTQASETSPSVNPPALPVPVPEPTIPALSANRKEELLAYIGSLSMAQDRLEQLSAFVWQTYGYSERNTTASDYTENRRQWQTEIRELTGIADLTPAEYRPPENLSVTLQRRVCFSKEPGEIKIGTVVNPGGSLQGEPVVLRSSGYSTFDEKAVEAVADHILPAEETTKAYTVTVLAEPDYGDRKCFEADQLSSGTREDTLERSVRIS
jgi:hypothetical protein